MLYGEWSRKVDVVSLPRSGDRDSVLPCSLQRNWDLTSRLPLLNTSPLQVQMSSGPLQVTQWEEHSEPENNGDIHSPCGQLKSFAPEPGVMCPFAMLQEMVANADSLHVFFPSRHSFSV